MRQAISTFFLPRNCPTCSPPRPLSPAMPMRTVSFAPSTLPDDLVPATVMVAAAASDDSRKRRRVRRMRGLQAAKEEGNSLKKRIPEVSEREIIFLQPQELPCFQGPIAE